MADRDFPLLATVLDPADLHGLDDPELAALGEEIRRFLRTAVSRTGGHLASNLGVVELTLALHRIFDFRSDRLLWDVGHQAYVHKLLTGRAQGFEKLRQRGGLSGFPDPKENPYDIAKVGHSSTAISTGVGLADGYRRRAHRRKTVVVVGDGALTGGMAFEGLINAGVSRSDLLVVLNDNGNFIDAPVGALHTYFDRVRSDGFYIRTRDRLLAILKRLPWGGSVERLAETAEAAARRLVSPGALFEDLGLRYFGPVDGHDRRALERMLKRVGRLRQPVIVHVHTRKGGGWKPAQDDPLTYHGPKGYDPDTGEFDDVAPGRPTYSKVFSATLADLADEDERILAVTAAMPTGTGLLKFAERHPERMIDVGICEQHSFAYVEGLILAGMKPVLAHYSTFAQRGYDQLFQEIVVQRDLGAVCTLDRAGLVGQDGETHQGLYDIAWSRCLPGTVLMSPRDGRELASMLRFALAEGDREERRACYLIRYPKEAVPADEDADPAPIALGRAEVLRRGEGPVMVWAYGAMVPRAAAALDELGEDGAAVVLVNARFAKPLDRELLAEHAAEHPHVVTIEDHALEGGFGSCVAEAVADLGLACTLHRCAVADELVAHGSREEQLADQGLDVPGLVARLRRILDLGDRRVLRLAR